MLKENSSFSSGRLAQLAAANPQLANLAGLGDGAGSSLSTEVQILKSPSVLKPVFDYVKAAKAEGGQDVKNWVYTNWVKNS